SNLRAVVFTSARVVASTRHAAYRDSPSRLPVMTTQFADTSSPTSYAAQNAAVSARSGSIAATKTDDTGTSCAQPSSADRTGAANRSGRSSATSVTSLPSTAAILRLLAEPGAELGARADAELAVDAGQGGLDGL